MATTITSTNTVTQTIADMCDDNYFYVDATLGDDGNDGHYYSPWQTITKVNASSFNPGDNILFKKGETWSGTRLAVPSSGSAGNPIVFGAYGTGALPIITSVGESSSIRCYQKNYITFENLHAKYGTTYVMCCIQSHDIVVDGCTIEGNLVQESDGLQVVGASANTYNITIRNCTAFNNLTVHSGGAGIMLNAATIDGPNNILIENNTCYNNGSWDSGGQHGIYVKWTTNAIVRNNTCYDNYAAGIKINRNAEDMDTYAIVYNNYCYGNGGEGLYISGGGDIFYNNLCVDNYNHIMLNGARNTLIYHNTFVNATSKGMFIWNSTTGNVIKNNIILQDNAVVGNSAQCVYTSTESYATNITWDNNLQYYIGVANMFYPGALKTWAGWQALGLDTNGVNANPVFTTDYTNLHLQVTSPCRNTGADLDIAADHDDVARDDTPDIGCYEYVA